MIKKITTLKKKIKKNKEPVKFATFVILIVSGFLLGANRDLLPDLVSKIRGQKLSSHEVVTAKEIDRILSDENAILINVHTPYEGEIAGTDLFIDYNMMKAGKDKLPADKNAKIVLYCRTGRMSEEALITLKGMGYRNVSHLDGGMEAWDKAGYKLLDLSNLPQEVLPEEGFELPISWGRIGPDLIRLGVIDREKFEKAVRMDDTQVEILTKGSDANIEINSQNSQFVVDILWALGLAQKSKVYDEGPMGKEQKAQAGNFASTGGWTLARGDAMNYYNKFSLVPLTPAQHDKVMGIAENVYRPCCGNHTAFPDCNHGMAALAAIELMVSKGLSDEEIYANVLKLNSFWFPQNYLTTATYFARQDIAWDDVDPKVVLGVEYSSGQGAQAIFQKVGPLPYGGTGGGSCGA